MVKHTRESRNWQEQDILKDKRKNGKVTDWRGKKLMNEEYSDILKQLKYLKQKRVSHCADVLRFRRQEDGRLRLYQAWFCKSRLCPMCAWRRSLLHANQVEEIVIEAIKREPKGRWLFLTFTTKNTFTAEELSEEISKMNTGLYNLFRRKRLAKNILGFLRATEVTKNRQDGSYNQHMHVLVFVKSTYFMDSENYISQPEWQLLWQKAMKLDYVPIVNVKAVKPKDKKSGEKGLIGAVYEVAKYPVKSVDFLNGEDEENQAVVDDLEHALSRKRLIAFGGLLKVIQKELNMKDADDKDADLIHVGEEDGKEETKNELIATWDNQRKNYFIGK